MISKMLSQRKIQGKYIFFIPSLINSKSFYFRLASYNCKYELEDGMKKSEIVLITFTPDGDDLTQA